VAKYKKKCLTATIAHCQRYVWWALLRRRRRRYLRLIRQ
jgi:hypothetical protein